MVSAFPFDGHAAIVAGVHDGMEALACSTTETLFLRLPMKKFSAHPAHFAHCVVCALVQSGIFKSVECR